MVITIDALQHALRVALGSDIKLTVVQLQAFLEIARRGTLGTTQADLMKFLGVSQAAASRVLSRLSSGSSSESVGKALGWVELLPDIDDPRIRVAFLTPAGQEALKSLLG